LIAQIEASNTRTAADSGLLSPDVSHAWCVFRFGRAQADAAHLRIPIFLKRTLSLVTLMF
jgi:hypothetical protein